jgi:hypothetical protein
VRLPRLTALCLLLLLPCGALADDIGPAQAQALQQQLTDWLAGLLGPGTTLPDLPLQITGEGDHYRATWPIPGLDSPPGGAAVTASVQSLGGGRWAIEAIKLPEAVSFTLTIPDTGDNGTSGPLKATITIGRQDSHAVIDPAIAGPSTLHLDLGDLAIATDSARQHQEQRIGRYDFETGLSPARDGRLDAAAEATVEGWETAARMADGAAIAIGAQKMHALGRVDGVNRDKAAWLVSAMNGFLRALPPDVVEKHGKGDLPAPARAQLRALIGALPDLLSAVRLEETVDGLQIEVAGMGGLALQHAVLGFGGEAPDGNLHAWFEIALDGLRTPSLPPKMTAYLPHHIALRPSIAGVRTADLAKLALDATEADAGDDTLGPDIAAIFAHGGVDFGVETLSFDLGPAKVEGVGKLVVLSPDSWHGEARLFATGLDELTAQVRKDPELKQALPVLIMLRGLAKPDGDRLVWDIASEGMTVTVNGIDLSALADSKPKAKPANPPQGQPRRR